MKKKIYTLRLYYPHDIDLLSFIEMHDIDFSETANQILRAFFEQKYFVLHPELRTEPFTGTRKRICRKELILDEDDEEDKKIISCLSLIRKGCINNFVKNLFRLYVCMPISRNELNWTKPGTEEFFSLFAALQKKKIETPIPDIPAKEDPEKDEIKNKELLEDSVTEKDDEANTLEKIDVPEQMNISDEIREPEGIVDQNADDDSFLTDLFSSLIM